jgi:hypothetical protein
MHGSKREGFYSSGQFSKSSDQKLKAKFRKNSCDENSENERERSPPKGPEIRVIGSKPYISFGE